MTSTVDNSPLLRPAGGVLFQQDQKDQLEIHDAGTTRVEHGHPPVRDGAKETTPPPILRRCSLDDNLGRSPRPIRGQVPVPTNLVCFSTFRACAAAFLRKIVLQKTVRGIKVVVCLILCGGTSASCSDWRSDILFGHH